MAVRNVESMMRFFGVKNKEKLVIEGHNQSTVKAEGLGIAVKLACTF